jgi:glycerate kinase
MTNDKVKDLRTKIEQGINLAYKRLILKKQMEDGDLVFTRNGKIIKIKAKELSK